MLMTFACFSIAKVQCQKFNIIEYLFSLSYMPMHDMLKIYIYIYMQRKIKKQKESKLLLNMVASVSLGNVRVIACISKVIVSINQL